jgi:hypothetical protein
MMRRQTGRGRGLAVWAGLLLVGGLILTARFMWPVTRDPLDSREPGSARTVQPLSSATSDPGQPIFVPLPTASTQIAPPSQQEEDVESAMAFYEAVIAPKVEVQDLYIQKMSEPEWLTVTGGSQYPIDEDRYYYIYAFSTRDPVDSNDFMLPMSFPDDPHSGQALSSESATRGDVSWHYLVATVDSHRTVEFGGVHPSDTGFLPRLRATGVTMR